MMARLWGAVALGIRCGAAMSALRIPLRHSLTCWPQPCRGLSRVFPASAPNTVLGVGVRSMYKSAEVSARGELHVVDLRSDTVTKPCAEMRRAMAEAEVGDDVYGEDPTVNEIQHRAAEIFGTENALFVTSGTMGNLISVMCHCQSRGAEILIGDESHIYMYEQGSSAQIAGVFARPVRTLKDGCLDLQDLESKIQHDYPDPHHAKTQLICLENTHNRMGGRVLPLSYLREVRSIADHYHLKVHLDGARLLNAAQSLGVEPAEIVQFFDSVSVCLSKGLGAPVGALLGGRTQFVADARRARKLLGGGMRQAGVLAAAGIVALKRAKENVVLDHQNAKAFAKGVEELASHSVLQNCPLWDSNMVMLKMNGKLTAQELCELLKEPDDKHGVCVQALSMSSQCVRLVWHRDISELDTKLALVKFTNVLQRYSEEQSRT